MREGGREGRQVLLRFLERKKDLDAEFWRNDQVKGRGT
jgi:hypothetical protein